MSITSSPSVSPQRSSSVSDNSFRSSRSSSPVRVLRGHRQTNAEEFITIETNNTPTPASPTLTPAQVAEEIQRLFTPEELAEHTPTREYIEQHLPR